MLRACRPQGTARSALTGTVGRDRSRLKTARDGLRPLVATAHNATRARLRFDTVSRTEAHHRGTGKPAQRALRASSSSREVAPRHRPSTRSGPSPARLNGPMSRESRIRSRAPTGHGHRRRHLAQNRTSHARCQASMTAGPRAGRQGSDRTTDPFTRGGAHRLASSHQHRYRPRGATYLGGRDEEELVHRPGAGAR